MRQSRFGRVLRIHQPRQVSGLVRAAIANAMANVPQHATTFTIVHTEFLPEVRGRRGRHKQASRATAAQPRRRFLHLHHFPSMITAILALNYFRVGKNVIKQKRGAPMGSPASPALCSMVIAVHEQGWTSTYRQLIHSHKSQQDASSSSRADYFCARYVDNRLLVIPTRFLQLPPFQQFTHPIFFVPPVELEHEPGFRL